MIRLTDEETEAIVTRHRQECEPCDYSFVEEGAKAQLKKMGELGRDAIYVNSDEGWFLKEGWESNATHIGIPIKLWQALLEATR